MRSQKNIGANVPLAMVGLALWVGACAGPKGASRPPEMPQDESRSKQPDGISTRAKLLFEDAVKAYEAQKKTKVFDYALLESKFQAALAADSNLAEADYNLGAIAERQGKTEEAIGHYQTALRKRPDLKEPAENLAVIAQNKGDLPEAVRMYKAILTNHPDDAHSRIHLAEIYRQGGEHDQALNLARQALMREPKAIGAYRVMMHSYMDRKQLSMAKLVGLRALKIDEADPEIHHTLGLVFLEEKDTAKARAQFKSALEGRPDYLPSRVILAKMSMEDGNYAAAGEHFRRILSVYPKNAEAHLNLGLAYKGAGQYDKAMQEYDEAEKLNPEMPEVYLSRGVILQKYKDAPDRALEHYRKYLALSGGEAAQPADAPVFALIQEAEQTVQARVEAKHAEEQAKKLEAAQREQQAQAKKLEEAQREQQARLQQEEQRPKEGAAEQDDPDPKKAKDASSRPAGSKGATRKAKTSHADQADEPSDKSGRL